MASIFTLNVNDHDNEKSPATFRGVDLTAVNFDAQATLRATLEAAVAAIIIGNINTRQVLALRENVTPGLPASPFAQRETKWLVTYSDNVTGDEYQLELPTADLSNKAGNTALMDVAPASQGADFVAAFEAFHLSPLGNAVTFIEARHVGRNI